jgi:hypothetical protein
LRAATLDQRRATVTHLRSGVRGRCGGSRSSHACQYLRLVHIALQGSDHCCHRHIGLAQKHGGAIIAQGARIGRLVIIDSMGQGHQN